MFIHASTITPNQRPGASAKTVRRGFLSPRACAVPPARRRCRLASALALCWASDVTTGDGVGSGHVGAALLGRDGRPAGHPLEREQADGGVHHRQEQGKPSGPNTCMVSAVSVGPSRSADPVGQDQGAAGADHLLAR